MNADNESGLRPDVTCTWCCVIIDSDGKTHRSYKMRGTIRDVVNRQAFGEFIAQFDNPRKVEYEWSIR